jgi:hypothetical protein
VVVVVGSMLLLVVVGRGGEGSSKSERACELGLIGGLLIGVAGAVLLDVDCLLGERR